MLTSNETNQQEEPSETSFMLLCGRKLLLILTPPLSLLLTLALVYLAHQHQLLNLNLQLRLQQSQGQQQQQQQQHEQQQQQQQQSSQTSRHRSSQHANQTHSQQLEEKQEASKVAGQASGQQRVERRTSLARGRAEFAPGPLAAELRPAASKRPSSRQQHQAAGSSGAQREVAAVGNQSEANGEASESSQRERQREVGRASGSGSGSGRRRGEEFERPAGGERRSKLMATAIGIELDAGNFVLANRCSSRMHVRVSKRTRRPQVAARDLQWKRPAEGEWAKIRLLSALFTVESHSELAHISGFKGSAGELAASEQKIARELVRLRANLTQLFVCFNQEGRLEARVSRGSNELL